MAKQLQENSLPPLQKTHTHTRTHTHTHKKTLEVINHLQWCAYITFRSEEYFSRCQSITGVTKKTGKEFPGLPHINSITGRLMRASHEMHSTLQKPNWWARNLFFKKLAFVLLMLFTITVVVYSFDVIKSSKLISLVSGSYLLETFQVLLYHI